LRRDRISIFNIKDKVKIRKQGKGGSRVCAGDSEELPPLRRILSEKLGGVN
jgi:hypothetical protein